MKSRESRRGIEFIVVDAKKPDFSEDTKTNRRFYLPKQKKKMLNFKPLFFKKRRKIEMFMFFVNFTIKKRFFYVLNHWWIFFLI